jgi:hypothetical protein
MTLRLRLRDRGDELEIEASEIHDMVLLYGTLFNAPGAAPFLRRFIAAEHGEAALQEPPPPADEAAGATSIPKGAPAPADPRLNRTPRPKKDRSHTKDLVAGGGKPASPAMLKYLETLGVEAPEGITTAEAQALAKQAKGVK